MPIGAILGCAGTSLSSREHSFFAEAQPWGFILFARNIETPEQTRALTSALREAVGRNAPILIDQEGGRVQRMRAPHWREYLPALDQMERAKDPVRAMWLRSRLIAEELRDVGIDVNCAPLADLVEQETHPVLRNRLYGSDVETVCAAAKACVAGHRAGGVASVLKHLPGYGRAAVDPHLGLPKVSEPLEALMQRDFQPFAVLNDLPMAMTAHMLVEALDAEHPATLSPAVISFLREQLDYDGLIMTDDISMEALPGTVLERSKTAWSAGCDVVLHCNGEMPEMEAIVTEAPDFDSAWSDRAANGEFARRPPEPIDIPAALAEFEELLKAS